MGFSISGSLGILLLALFVASGMLVSAGTNSLEHVRDAYRSSNDHRLDQEQTAINITDAVWNDPLPVSGDEYLVVNVTNTGTRTLRISDTDLIIDGNYSDSADITSSTIDGDDATDLWAPGEQLRYEVNNTLIPNSERAKPERIKVVTEHGVADTTGVA